MSKRHGPRKMEQTFVRHIWTKDSSRIFLAASVRLEILAGCGGWRGVGVETDRE